ncbi:MAG: GntR family transcriptional regulator [Bryobacteraceae bacterium]|nr:GntR family transcriptional regulator [Bryobacteraceae bacterium]
MSRLKPIAPSSVGRQVAHTIRDAICSGRIALGEPLRELHLARELNVSQVSVREALLELANQGLVVRTPNVGTVVTQLTSEDVRQRVQVRVSLETLAFVEASKRVKTSDFKQLEGRLEVLSQAIARNDCYESAQADLQFHRYVWQISGNELLVRTLEQMTIPLFAFVCIVRSTGTQDLSKVVKAHSPLIAALRRGDALSIENAVRTHIERSYETFFASGLETCNEFAQSLG